MISGVDMFIPACSPFIGFVDSSNTQEKTLIASQTVRSNMSCNNDWLTAIDVSQYQGNIIWKKVKDAGIDFAYIRSNAGLNEDDLLRQNCNRAKKNSIPFGL